MSIVVLVCFRWNSDFISLKLVRFHYKNLDIKTVLLFSKLAHGSVQRTISLVNYVHALVISSRVQDVMPVMSGRRVVTFFTRVNGHLTSDETSHIHKYLCESSHCRSLSSPNSFKILDQGSTEYELRIKEAIYIHLEKPFLNKQVKRENIKLFL